MREIEAQYGLTCYDSAPDVPGVDWAYFKILPELCEVSDEL